MRLRFGGSSRLQKEESSHHHRVVSGGPAPPPGRVFKAAHACLKCHHVDILLATTDLSSNHRMLADRVGAAIPLLL